MKLVTKTITFTETDNCFNLRSYIRGTSHEEYIDNNNKFLSIVIFFSCTDNNEEVKTVSPSDSISAFLNLPTSIELFGDKLFVVDPFDKEGMVKVIDLKTKDICFQFAPKGEGPNELLHVGSMDIYRDVKNNMIINLFDPTTQRLYIYNYDSLSIMRNKYTPEVHNLSDSDVSFHELLKIDNGYVTTGKAEKYKYIILSDSFQVIDQFGMYRKKPSDDIPDMLHAIANYGKSFISGNRYFLAEIIYNAPVLSFYDLKKKEKLWEYCLGDLDYRIDGESIIYKSVVGYLSISLTDKYIYALYSGEKDKEDDIATYGKMIHIFNYDGELVNKYQLSISAFSISVDYENKKLYALSHQPEPKIYIYDLFYY